MKKSQIFFKDTDPDTGLLSQVKKVCECEDEQTATYIQKALSFADSEEPNREYYVVSTDLKTENLIICVEPEKIEMARLFQNWCADRGVQCVVCFSAKDAHRVASIYREAKVKFMITIVGQSAEFEGIQGWDLKMSQFEDEYDFDTVYSLLY